MRNFFALYRPLASTWRMYDNARGPEPRLIASGRAGGLETVADLATWSTITKDFADAD